MDTIQMGLQSCQGRADAIAVYVAESASVFTVPVEECPAYLGLLRLQPPRNNQRRGIRFAEQYSFENGSASFNGWATRTNMLIALISDTHMPKGTRRLPDACVERLKQADLIIHAGDLSTMAVLQELGSYSQVIAVHGNVDDAEVRAALPETVTFDADDVTLAVIHDAGRAQGRLDRLKRRFPDAQAVVFGHSHQPLHQESPDGFQIFNPGSPTERRRASWPSMGVARAHQGQVSFELIRLD